jgi:hypothetical protein
MKKCDGCGKVAGKFAEFPCVECGEMIVRCHHCRELGVQYICKKCRTEGP